MSKKKKKKSNGEVLLIIKQSTQTINKIFEKILMQIIKHKKVWIWIIWVIFTIILWIIPGLLTDYIYDKSTPDISWEWQFIFLVTDSNINIKNQTEYKMFLDASDKKKISWYWTKWIENWIKLENNEREKINLQWSINKNKIYFAYSINWDNRNDNWYVDGEIKYLDENKLAFNWVFHWSWEWVKWIISGYKE